MACKALAIDQSTDADVLVKKGTCYFCGISLLVGADATIKIYDHEAVAGVADTDLIAAGKWDVSVDGYEWNLVPAEPILCKNGLVIVITDGAGTVGAIWYR